MGTGINDLRGARMGTGIERRRRMGGAEWGQASNRMGTNDLTGTGIECLTDLRWPLAFPASEGSFFHLHFQGAMGWQD